MNDTLYIPASPENEFVLKNFKPLNLNVGKDLKRFIELSGVACGTYETGKPYGHGQMGVLILSSIFPKCEDGKYFEWIKAAAKNDNRSVTGWVRHNFPEKVPVKADYIVSLPTIADVAEMFHWMRKFKSTTAYYNAIRYIKGEGVGDMSWSIGFKKTVDELKEFYKSQNNDYKFYNPLKP